MSCTYNRDITKYNTSIITSQMTSNSRRVLVIVIVRLGAHMGVTIQVRAIIIVIVTSSCNVITAMHSKVTRNIKSTCNRNYAIKISSNITTNI